MIELQSITLPDGFLREETRDGYTISAKMKEIWAVELDLLQCFINVCEKNGLRYFMDGGTLLGAARHHGFVPWDNDIDMGMPLEDYLKLREIAGNEFKAPYLFQSEYDFARGGKVSLFSKLRNTGTTAIFRVEFDKKFSHNQGIFIDIFPMYGMPPAPERQQFIREMLECKKQMSILSRKRSNDLSLDIGNELSALVAQMERLLARYPISPATKKVGLLSNAAIGRDNNIYNYWDFQDTVPLPFEMLTPAAPRGYKNMLRVHYGVWKKPVQQFAHGGIFFDTDRPCEYWLSQPVFPED